MCLVTGTVKIGTPSKEPGAGGWYPKGKRRLYEGSGAGDGNPGGKRRPEGTRAEGVSVRKEEDPRRGAGQGVWESGGKGKPPRKKKRILKGEVKNLGNLPIKKVRTSMMEGKEGELSCE